MELKKYKLGDLCKFINGRAYLQPELQESGKYKIVRVGNLSGGNNSWYFSDMELESDKYCNKGDLLYAWACNFGPHIWNEDKTIYHYHIWKVINSDKIDKIYLYYMLKFMTNSFMGCVHGSTMLHITKENMEGMEVLIHPSLREQRDIAKCLSDIDRKIELNHQINATLESMAKQLYDYWFVQFDFPNEEGKPYKSSGGAMVWNEKLKREIPYGWEVVNVSDIANVRRGQIITSKETSQGDIKVVAAAVTFSYLNGESNRPKNTITVSGSGANAGFINFWREPIFASDCTTVNCNTDIDTILCLYGLSLFQERLYNLAIGAAQPHVYPAHVANIPTLAIPQNLKQRVSDFFCKSNDVIAANLAEVENLTKLRDELLPLLMNGQATVEN